MEKVKHNIVGIHQPNFLPWLGYFYKIAQSDTFIFYDTAEYTKKSFIRRTNIHKRNSKGEDLLLSVPLKKHSDFSKINELQMQDSHTKWKQKIEAIVYETYHKFPYFDQVERIMMSFSKPHTFLSEMNIDLIRQIANSLELKTQFHKSSALQTFSKASKANIEMCQKLKATHYFSGLGAKKYQSEADFVSKGIKLVYSDFDKHWSNSKFKPELKSKSILSHIASYSLDEIHHFLTKKTC